MPKPPTKMWQVFHFVAHYKVSNDGNPPTRTDISKHFGINRTAVDQHLTRLMRKGRVRFDEHGRVILIGGVYEAPEE